MASKNNIEKIEPSFSKALTFIWNNRRPDGLWSDFLTLAGESIHWVSGYVGYAILSALDNAAQSQNLNEVSSKILKQQNPDGGWGYGPGVPSDADSTSWCLLFLSRRAIQNYKSEENAFSFLLKHQSKSDGGFRTYADPLQIARYMRLTQNISFEGWSSSQMCVTAVACQALIENHFDDEADTALAYIRKGQTFEGSWNPYWWNGKLYATFNCMLALKQRGNIGDNQLLSKAQEWIVSSQLQDGGWSDSSNQQESWAFSTALAVKALMLSPEAKYVERIKEGIQWLLEHQLEDGSWNSNHILRIPYPFMKEPWLQDDWRTDGKAMNAAIKDHKRLHTTATALSALSGFKNYPR